MSHSVIQPPHPGGQPVGDHDVNAVVTSSDEQHYNSTQTNSPRCPVEKEETPGRIYSENINTLHFCNMRPGSFDPISACVNLSHCLMAR